MDTTLITNLVAAVAPSLLGLIDQNPRAVAGLALVLMLIEQALPRLKKYAPNSSIEVFAHTIKSIVKILTPKGTEK